MPQPIHDDCPCCNNRLRWWPKSSLPVKLLAKLYGSASIRAGALPSWVDHPYRYKLPDGQFCYVAEPYSVSEEALSDLAHFGRNGLSVSITTVQALHLPGATLAVHIWPAGAEYIGVHQALGIEERSA